MERRRQLHTFLSAAATTGAGTAMNVSSYRHITVAITTASSANMTIKCQGSIGKAAGGNAVPAFGSAASATNVWDYVGMYNLNTASLTSGDTGVVYDGTDAVELLTINTDGIEWLNFNVTARAAGAVSVFAVAYYNE